MTAPAVSTNYSDSTRQTSVQRSTETKAGPKTTEFMVAIAFVVTVLVAAYVDGGDAFSRADGWRYAAIVATGYIVSRGLAKLGVREPYTDTPDHR